MTTSQHLRDVVLRAGTRTAVLHHPVHVAVVHHDAPGLQLVVRLTLVRQTPPEDLALETCQLLHLSHESPPRNRLRGSNPPVLLAQSLALALALLPEQLDDLGDLGGGPSAVLLGQAAVVVLEERDVVVLAWLGNGLGLR